MKWVNQFSSTAMTIALAAAVAAVGVRADGQDAANQAEQTQTQPEQQPGQAQQTGQAQQNAQTQRAGQAQQAQGQQPQAQAQQNREEAQQARQDDGKDRRKLKVIELEHREPQQLTQLFNLWDQTVSMASRPGYQAPVATAGAAGQTGQQAEGHVAIAMDQERKLLFVRGSEEQLEKISSLVSKMDVADDELEKYDFANHRLIPIHSQDTGKVQSTLSQLGLSGRTIQLGRVSLVAYRVDDDHEEKLQQAEEVIDKLCQRDKDAKAEDANGEQAQQDDAQDAADDADGDRELEQEQDAQNGEADEDADADRDDE